MSAWLVCYDITCERRLQRLHKRIARHAHSVQRSVYYFEGDTKGLEALLDLTRCFIDTTTDDLRVYPVQGLDRIRVVGKPACQTSALDRKVWAIR